MIQFKAPDLAAPDGSIIGVIEEGGVVEEGKVWLTGLHAERVGPEDPIPDQPGNYILDHALSKSDAVAKSRAVARVLQLRRAGATIVLISHDEGLLESCADEIWWIQNHELIARGDPSEVLARYRRHVAEALRSAGEQQLPAVSPTMRNGDGRAELERIELLGESGELATVWRSGEAAAIRVTVRFVTGIEDPVIGIMIRTRIGLNVYGTNTELERLKLGPCMAGNTLELAFAFWCELCPGEYTLTVASHDPDGVWHDWLEDAVAFSVTDTRYTAGVANLRAQVSLLGRS